MRLDSTSAGVLHSAPESPERLGADFPNCRYSINYIDVYLDFIPGKTLKNRFHSINNPNINSN